MLSRHCLALGLVFSASLALSATSPAIGEESFTACETQQEIEQVIQSEGDLMPDGCRILTLTTLDTDHGELCVLDFEAADPGVLDTLRDAAMPTQWWVECAALAGR